MENFLSFKKSLTIWMIGGLVYSTLSVVLFNETFDLQRFITRAIFYGLFMAVGMYLFARWSARKKKK